MCLQETFSDVWGTRATRIHFTAPYPTSLRKDSVLFDEAVNCAGDIALWIGGGMVLTLVVGGNPVPVPFSPQVPHKLAWDRNLTSW
jgi:hypothetical protein